ncbi:MAG TPA: paraquat-inducible protein A [Opitutales bacterium]|jgi:paraquat-inducible protein A|nr:paraquat-inducible protein A [Opitutales bacterium]
MKPLKSFSNSANITLAASLALAAAIMLIPANMLPIIYTQNAGRIRTDTIFSGIVGLCRQGWWSLGVIVFIASIFIPIFKLASLAWLIFAARQGPGAHARRLTRLYVVLSVIGRWSMLDVFLVAFLSGVVQFGVFAKVEPRSGIIAFAAVVVLTVLANEAFDPRILWGSPASNTPQPSSK